MMGLKISKPFKGKQSIARHNPFFSPITKRETFFSPVLIQPKRVTGGLTSLKSQIFNPIIQKEEGETDSTSAIQNERNAYLQMVQSAVNQIADPGLASTTFSDTLLPLFREMSRPTNVIWRTANGTETSGRGGRFRLSGPRRRGRPRSLRFQLVLAEDMDAGFNGTFNESNRRITLNRSDLNSVEAIRNTLYHEGIHLLSSLRERYGESAIGGRRDVSVQMLSQHIQSSSKSKLRRWLELLRNAINTNRSQRGEGLIPSASINTTADFLWEEISVRAETYYFKLQIWLGEEHRMSDGLPSRNYLSNPSVKRYLKQAGFLNDSDIALFGERENQNIDSLRKVLMYSQRLLIKGRGVPNQFIPHPLEPQRTINITPIRRRFNTGSMGRIRLPNLRSRIRDDARGL